MQPRFKNHCEIKGCCVFVGGTADYDIWMAKCDERPYDPMVLFVTENGTHDFKNRESMDATLDEWDRQGHEMDKLRLAQTFVHTFFPTPVRVAMDRLAKGEDL